MKPVIEKLAKEGADAGKWILAEVDVDESPGIKDKHQVEYCPTLMPLRDKAEIPDSRRIGFDGDAAALEQYIKDQIAKG